MGRAKIPMEPMTNPKKRKATFNSRNNGMMKKARELATLCDVKVSIIIFTDDQETPQIFPPDHDELISSIDVYNRTRPESIKRYALSDYYADRKMKVEEELVKTKKKNLESKFPSWFGFLDDFSEAGLRELALGLENKIVDVQSRLECLKNIQNVGLGLYNNINNNNQQSWNPTNIMRPSDSLMNMQMLNEDVDGNLSYYDDNFSLELPPLMMLNEDFDDNVIYDDGENVSPELPPLRMLNEDVDDNVIMMSSDSLMLNEDDDGDNFSLELRPLMMLNEEDVDDNVTNYDDGDKSWQQLLMSGFQ